MLYDISYNIDRTFFLECTYVTRWLEKRDKIYESLYILPLFPSHRVMPNTQLSICSCIYQKCPWKSENHRYILLIIRQAFDTAYCTVPHHLSNKMDEMIKTMNESWCQDPQLWLTLSIQFLFMSINMIRTTWKTNSRCFQKKENAR